MSNTLKQLIGMRVNGNPKALNIHQQRLDACGAFYRFNGPK